MKMRKSVLVLLLSGLMTAPALVLPPQRLLAEPPGTDQDKPDAAKAAAALEKAFKDADVVFTAVIGKVQPMGHTNSLPATAFGKVTFKDLKALRGALPETATFSYSCTDGVTQNFDLSLKDQVIVAAKQKGVIAIVPATTPNLDLANKTGEGDK